MHKHPGRGGKRTGAGRPPTGKPQMKRKTVTLAPDDIATLEAINTNLSAAIRILIARSQKT